MLLKALDTKQGQLFLELVNIIVESNGIVDELEKQVFNEFRYELSLSEEEYFLKKLSLNEILQQLAESDVKAKRIIFLEVLAIAFVDGEIIPEEKILDNIRNAFEISIEQYEKYKEWVIDMNVLYARIRDLINES